MILLSVNLIALGRIRENSPQMLHHVHQSESFPELQKGKKTEIRLGRVK